MPFSFSVFFRNLFRPKVTSARVILYENGKEVDISKYQDLQLALITKAINELFQVEAKSPYWFETEVYEQCSCFKKVPPIMTIHCYSHDITKQGFKRKFPIPIKYRKKMFDNTHIIRPDPIGPKTWPAKMEVKFRLREF